MSEKNYSAWEMCEMLGVPEDFIRGGIRYSSAAIALDICQKRDRRAAKAIKDGCVRLTQEKGDKADG